MASLYKQYMRLLKKWPVDKTRTPDLGQFIREEVKIAFAKGEKSKVEDVEKCKRYLESLNRIADNHYKKKYPVNFKNTSTGLTPEQCSAALSQEFQEYLQEEHKSYFAKLKDKIKDIFNNSPKS